MSVEFGGGEETSVTLPAGAGFASGEAAGAVAELAGGGGGAAGSDAGETAGAGADADGLVAGGAGEEGGGDPAAGWVSVPAWRTDTPAASAGSAATRATRRTILMD